MILLSTIIKLSMLKKRTILLGSLLIATCSFSQTTFEKSGENFLLTPYQLKITNLIFNEHKYLLVNDSLQKIQINNYKSLVNTLDSTLTYKDYQIKIQSDKNNELYIQNKKLSKLNYLFGGISILSIICALIH